MTPAFEPIRGHVGEKNVIRDAAEMAGTEGMARYLGWQITLVMRPSSTEEVSPF